MKQEDVKLFRSPSKAGGTIEIGPVGSPDQQEGDPSAIAATVTDEKDNG